jgi:hypothetical protein
MGIVVFVVRDRNNNYCVINSISPVRRLPYYNYLFVVTPWISYYYFLLYYLRIYFSSEEYGSRTKILLGTAFLSVEPGLRKNLTFGC